MVSVRKISRYLYPLNPKSGFVLKICGREISTGHEDFFKVLNYATIDIWGFSNNAQAGE